MSYQEKGGPPDHLRRHTSPLTVAPRVRRVIPPPSTLRERSAQAVESQRRTMAEMADEKDSGNTDGQDLSPFRPMTTQQIRGQQKAEGRARRHSENEG